MIDVSLACTPREIGSCLINKKCNMEKLTKSWHRTLTAAAKLGLKLYTAGGIVVTTEQIKDCLTQLENCNNVDAFIKVIPKYYSIANVNKEDEELADKVRLIVIDELI